MRDKVRIERSWLADLADVVLIDGPPNLGTLSVAAIAVADAVLIPFTPEDASLGRSTFCFRQFEPSTRKPTSSGRFQHFRIHGVK